MKLTFFRRPLFVAALLLLTTVFSFAQQTQTAKTSAQITAKNIRAHMEVLAGDEMNGRGSGTKDELRAGEYIAGQLKQFHIKPGAADGKSYIQTVSMTRNTFAEAPKLNYKSKDG